MYLGLSHTADRPYVTPLIYFRGIEKIYDEGQECMDRRNFAHWFHF